MELYLGISGGHSKSTAIAISDSKVLGCITGDSLNLHTFHYMIVAERLARLFDALARRIGMPSSARLREQTIKLTVALPGAATLHDQSLARLCLESNGWHDMSKYLIVDDTWAGLIAGALAREGICAFSGTGASVFVGLGEFLCGAPNKIDGHGPILGDHGSGFQLAMSIFRFIGRSLDKGIVPQLFYELISFEPQIRELDNIQRWFDVLYILHPADWRIKFAKLAAVAVIAADRVPSDPDAVNLISEAATGIFDTIQIALRRFSPMTANLPIVFQGGMFEHSKLYRELVSNSITKLYPNEIRMATFRTVMGAALMSCASDNILPHKDFIQELIEDVNRLPPEEADLLSYR